MAATPLLQRAVDAGAAYCKGKQYGAYDEALADLIAAQLGDGDAGACTAAQQLRCAAHLLRCKILGTAARCAQSTSSLAPGRCQPLWA